MDASTPITLAAASYGDRDGAVSDFHTVWGARHEGEFDHMAVAVLTKDAAGNVQVERHDSTTKHLAWGGAILGAALVVVAPPVGAAVLASGAAAGAGAWVGHFHHNIPKKDVEAAANLLEAGHSGLIVVAVNRRGEDIEPLLRNADKTVVTNTTWGNLDAEIDKEIANAQQKSE
jgi:hypothetical protein